jgi:peptidoglycan/LPS O-acetylase OafA/YrhL
VVANHLFPTGLTGGYLGVDIFFVISGFLITSHLVGEAQRTGRIALGRFWARRARRLLPASLLVLAFSALGTVLWLPQSRWSQVMHEILASALYVQNWQLAASAQDYFRSSQSPSPVTHYWSLSAEEQFYLVWPLLTLGVWWLARRSSADVRRRVLAAAMSLVVVASLVCVTVWLVRSPHTAYFATPARAWEFGIGAVLGCLPRLPRLPRLAAAPGWVAMGVSVLVFGESSSVPGVITLVPVLGCALVIWAGTGSGGEHTPRALRLPVWVGDISYSVYLWHWPLIVLAPYVLDRPMGPTARVGVLLLTLPLAHLSTRFVEDPFRRARSLAPTHRSLLAAAVGMAVVAAIAVQVPRTLSSNLADVQEEMESLVDAGGRCTGASAAGNECPDSHQLRVANADLVTISNSPYHPAWGGSCQVEPEDPAPAPCEFGVPEKDAEARIALVGDSHAGHWAAPLDLMAQEHGWNVVMQVKSSCQPVDGDLRASWSTEAAVASCRAWGKQVSRSLAEDPDIDVVVVSGISRSYISDDPDSVVEQWRAQWRRWIEAGKQVVVIADVPMLGRGDVPACLGAATTIDDPCSTGASKADSPDPLVAAARGLDGVRLFDPSRFLCGGGSCHAVVGGLPVYGDEAHLNSYFSRTFAPMLAPVVAEAVAGQGR